MKSNVCQNGYLFESSRKFQLRFDLMLFIFQQKRLESAFKTLLRQADPPIDEKSRWEEVCSKMHLYVLISTRNIAYFVKNTN